MLLLHDPLDRYIPEIRICICKSDRNSSLLQDDTVRTLQLTTMQ